MKQVPSLTTAPKQNAHSEIDDAISDLRSNQENTIARAKKLAVFGIVGVSYAFVGNNISEMVVEYVPSAIPMPYAKVGLLIAAMSLVYKGDKLIDSLKGLYSNKGKILIAALTLTAVGLYAYQTYYETQTIQWVLDQLQPGLNYIIQKGGGGDAYIDLKEVLEKVGEQLSTFCTFYIILGAINAIEAVFIGAQMLKDISIAMLAGGAFWGSIAYYLGKKTGKAETRKNLDEIMKIMKGNQASAGDAVSCLVKDLIAAGEQMAAEARVSAVTGFFAQALVETSVRAVHEALASVKAMHGALASVGAVSEALASARKVSASAMHRALALTLIKPDREANSADKAFALASATHEALLLAETSAKTAHNAMTGVETQAVFVDEAKSSDESADEVSARARAADNAVALLLAEAGGRAKAVNKALDFDETKVRSANEVLVVARARSKSVDKTLFAARARAKSVDEARTDRKGKDESEFLSVSEYEDLTNAIYETLELTKTSADAVRKALILAKASAGLVAKAGHKAKSLGKSADSALALASASAETVVLVLAEAVTADEASDRTVTKALASVTDAGSKSKARPVDEALALVSTAMASVLNLTKARAKAVAVAVTSANANAKGAHNALVEAKSESSGESAVAALTEVLAADKALARALALIARNTAVGNGAFAEAEAVAESVAADEDESSDESD